MTTEKKPRGRPVNPNKPQKQVKFQKGDKTRPALWKSGPDLFRHELHHAFLKRKAQANFRKEGWDMTFEEFFELWQHDWYNRGRLSHQVCMSRYDDEKPWTRDNTYIRSRYEQLLEQAHKRRGQGYKQRLKAAK